MPEVTNAQEQMTKLESRRLELGKAVAVDAYVADFMLFRNCARPQAEDSLP